MALVTYGDLKGQITSDLRRSNLTTEVANTVLDAIRDHDGERFYFNQTSFLNPEYYTLNTTAGNDRYAIAPQAPVAEFIMIDAVKAQVGNTWYELKRDTPAEIDDAFAVPVSGQPLEYAHLGNSIRMYPTPNAVFPVKIFGHFRIIALANDADTNAWTTVAKNLIRYSTVKRLYAYPIRDRDQAQIAEQAEVRELEYLRRETERRARSGRMKAWR
jgi:hypothetical protein